MYIVLAYDIEAKRVGKVMKTVKKYLHMAQRSVFEGYITVGNLNKLKSELQSIIVPDSDSVIIYKFMYHGYPRREVLGKEKAEDRFIL